MCESVPHIALELIPHHHIGRLFQLRVWHVLDPH